MDILTLLDYSNKSIKTLISNRANLFQENISYKKVMIIKKAENEEKKIISKKTENNIPNKRAFFKINSSPNILLFFILISSSIIPLYSYSFDIKIYVSNSKNSRLIDINGRVPSAYCKNQEGNYCLGKSSNDFNNNNNILYIKGDNTNSDYFYIKWNTISSLKGMFKDCHNITSIEFVGFDDFDSIFDTSELFLNCTSLASITFNSNKETKIFKNVVDMSYMFANCSSLTELNIREFETTNVKKMNSMFEFCKNINKIEQNFDTKLVTNMEFMFSNCQTIVELDISNFEIIQVTNMNSMFKGCTKLKELNLPHQKTPSLTDMGAMFQSCSSFTSLDLNSFDTSSVLFMNDLFHDCTSLTTISISNFSTENVIKMESMFENCKGLSSIDLRHFYTPSLRQFHYMFSGCISVQSIDISNFDTFQVTNFACLFYNCNSLTSINSLSNLTTNMVNNISHLFYNCSSLTSIDLSKFKTEKVTDMNSLFKGCSLLTSINLGNFTNTHVENMAEMFSGCNKLGIIEKTNFGTKKVKYMQGMFKDCITFKSLDLSFFETSNVVNMYSFFYGCYSLNEVNISSFDTSKVTDMSYMFYECSNLLDINITHFDTHNVKNMDSMFFNCKNIKSLSLINFDTSQVTSMKSIFYRCTMLELLDLSNFNTQNVFYMDSLFYECSSLIKLDLENFTLTKVKSMGYMFHGCISLTSIILPDITKLAVTNTSYMFDGCASLITIDLPNFDSSNIITMDYMFSHCSNLENIYFHGWNTKKVRTMDYLFNGCASLKYLDLTNIETPQLRSIKGMFYACSSLEYIDLTNFNTSLVTNMDFLFFKDFSLKKIIFLKENFTENMNNTELSIPNFSIASVETMRYMFSFCSQLKILDLYFFNISNVIDTSYMFANCSNLTSLNLRNFKTDNLITMEKMFYGCLNLSYINLNDTIDKTIVNYDSVLDETPINMVICLDQDKSPKLSELIRDVTKGCTAIDCFGKYDYIRQKRLINDNLDNDNQEIVCTDYCKKYNKFHYLFDCISICPNGTYEELNEDYIDADEDLNRKRDHVCEFLEKKPEVCTLQKVIIGKITCPMWKYERPYNNTKEDKVLMIEDIKSQLPNFDIILPQVYENGLWAVTIYNETYQFSLLSDKTMYDNLTYIDIKDCENLLKQTNEVGANEDLILLKIEYYTEDYKIPIIEYTVFKKDGTELNIDICHNMKFIYYIPVEIDQNIEYKYDPASKYHNELCFQYTTESKTDIILYERKKEFNDNNMSLCENGCEYLGYENYKVICECPVKSQFNQFLVEDNKDKDDIIFKFKNIQFEKYNFRVLKCFKMIFSKSSLKKNLASQIYLGIMAFNVLSALVFCIRGYKLLYIQTRLLVESLNPNIDNKENKNISILKNTKSNNKNNKTKNNMITTGQNPPPKIKNNKVDKKGGILNVKDLEKKIGKGPMEKAKIEGPSRLMDSKNKMNSMLGNSALMINRNDEKEDDLSDYKLYKSDMETNMLSYPEAQKKDKRSCFIIYFSFIKTRHLLVCIFFRDFNSIVFKVCFFFFVFGICLGINAIFVNDEFIQNIYEANGDYKIINHIVTHIFSIVISTIGASIIKSIVALISFTDVAVLEVKEFNNMSNENKINQALVRMTSRISRFYLINIILMSVFWIYTGSICSVFNNSQLYLIINAGVSFVGVIILPILYYFIPAILRASALSGKDSKCLYKFSQFFELI